MNDRRAVPGAGCRSLNDTRDKGLSVNTVPMKTSSLCSVSPYLVLSRSLPRGDQGSRKPIDPATGNRASRGTARATGGAGRPLPVCGLVASPSRHLRASFVLFFHYLDAQAPAWRAIHAEAANVHARCNCSCRLSLLNCCGSSDPATRRVFFGSLSTTLPPYLPDVPQNPASSS